MSKQCLFFLAFITIFCGCRSLQSSNQYTGIYISTPTDWLLDIKPDGSGEYGFGSSFFHFAYFASGTFNFDEIFDKLSAITTFENGNIREYYVVALQKKDSTSTVGVYTKDKDLIRKLFELAHKNRGIHDLTQTDTVRVKASPYDYMNKIWSERPPFPD